MYEVPEKKSVSINFSCAMFSLLDFLTPKMGPIGRPKTSVRNYNSMLHNSSEEHRSHMMIW